MSWATTWGSTEGERNAIYPCDGQLAGADTFFFRAVTVHAPPAIVFRWLCQLRVAPYSYDWVDNMGKQSPRTLTAGLDTLAVGQRVMRIFQLVDFAPNRHMTMILSDPGSVRLFGELALSYVVDASEEGSRLVVKVNLRSPPGWLGRARTKLLAIGDLVMMRKQLLTLKRLAERPN